MGKRLYAGARKAAFKQVKEQSAGQWKKVRAIKDSEQREMAEAVLKLQLKTLVRQDRRAAHR